MNIRLMPRALPVLCAMALLAAACGSDNTTTDTADPEPTTSPTTAVEPDDDDGEVVEAGETPTDADSDDEPETEATPVLEATPPPIRPAALFTVFTSGGFVPVEIALSAFPELVIMPDGVVYRPGAQTAVFPPPLTPAIERIQLDADALDEILRLISSDDLPPPATDFGSPNITDVATTVVTWLQTEEVVASVYALGFDVGLTTVQADSRAKVSTLVAAVEGIVDAASATAELTRPPALGLLTFPGLAFQEDAVVLDWPIESVPVPQAGGADCTVVSGDELGAIWVAATGATTQTPWRIEGEAKVVAFRPVFPYEDFC